MPDWLDPGPLVLAWLFIAGIGALAAFGFHCIASAIPTLPPQRRRATPWNGPLVLLAFVVFIYVPFRVLPFIDRTALMQWLGGPNADPVVADRFALAVAGLIALPIQIGLWYAIARFAGGLGPVFGVAPRRFGADFCAGYFTWLVLSPIVYFVSFAASLLYFVHEARPPDEHPVLKLLQVAADSHRMYGLLAAQAVLAAPVGEELFFRGIVQPYLTNRAWGGVLGLGLAAFVGVMFHWPGNIAFQDLGAFVDAVAPALFVLAMMPLYLSCDPWLPEQWLPIHDPQARRQVLRGIVGTALLFANVHANVWPTPIPLFVLALGLGWLAYRTQGVVAPIVLHMLFNAIPMLFIPRLPAG